MDKLNYKFYFKKYVKESYVAQGDLDAAYLFLATYNFGIVKDSNGQTYKTKEELEDAENIRSKYKPTIDNGTRTSRTFFESSDSKLPWTTGDNSE